jgi:anti-sigma factor RsiW
MTSLLQQLNNESLLLMYVADELPADDRADLEQILAGNPAMRAELDALRLAYSGATDALRAADARDRMPVSSNIASRRVGRVVRAWHARRSSMPVVERDGRRLRFPLWVYPLASSAAIVLVIVSWWGMNPDRGPKVLKAMNPVMLSAVDDEETESEASTMPWDAFAVARDESDTVLDETEDELYALSESGGNVSEIFLLSETDEQ